MRETDLLVTPTHTQGVIALIGGDEFLICLSGISHQHQSSRVAERFLKALSEPVLLGQKNERIFINGSLGIAIYPQAGYSSLGYLREFEVDGLKIDRSFVADIEQDSHDRALCAAIISMAKDLGIQVVAEGIETATQAEFLRQKRCDVGQGYYFSRPLPADEFTQKYLSCRKILHIGAQQKTSLYNCPNLN